MRSGAAPALAGDELAKPTDPDSRGANSVRSPNSTTPTATAQGAPDRQKAPTSASVEPATGYRGLDRDQAEREQARRRLLDDAVDPVGAVADRQRGQLLAGQRSAVNRDAKAAAAIRDHVRGRRRGAVDVQLARAVRRAGA